MDCLSLRWTHSSLTGLLKGFHQSERFLHNLPISSHAKKSPTALFSLVCSNESQTFIVSRVQTSYISFPFGIIFEKDVFSQRIIYESVCEVRETQWCRSVQWRVLSSWCSVYSIARCIHKASSSLAFLEWLTFLLSPSVLFFFFNYFWSTYGLHKQSQDVCPPLSFLRADFSFLLYLCWKTEVRWRQSKSTQRSFELCFCFL